MPNELNLLLIAFLYRDLISLTCLRGSFPVPGGEYLIGFSHANVNATILELLTVGGDSGSVVFFFVSRNR